jgi:glycosyltransferase involved in cell wall biosynthesis
VRIVYLINQYPAVTHTFIKREILALERRGLKVLRVAARPGGNLVDPTDHDEEELTAYLLESRAKLIGALMWALAARPAGFWASLGIAFGFMRKSDRPPLMHLVYFVEACRLAQIARRAAADHIHAHFGTNPAELSLLASRIADLPFSFTVHGYDEYDRPEFLGLDTKTRHARFVASVSHYGRSQLLRWCEPGDRDKIALVRCGLERGYAKEKPSETAMGARRFVCVGRLCREKAQDVLIRAAAALAARGIGCELVLVGDGPARGEIEALVDELGLDHCVRLRGWLSSEQVREEILAARALVVASFAENLPVVIMEAMALGRPVIATWISGIPELVIPGETGWLTPAGSVDHLAQALQACLDAPEPVLRRMGERGRTRVATQHDVDREAAQLAALFAQSCAPADTPEAIPARAA